MLNSISTIMSANMWTSIINFFADWIVNYGWAIIVFTIILKLVLSPLDILQKVSANKQAKVTTALKPEMDALQQKYGNDREKLNQETNKLYKKYNVNMGGICLPMLISLVLTLVIFFTLFGAIRDWGNERLYSSYAELENTYAQAVVDYSGDEALIEKAVEDKYTELSEKNSWLWIKNVWKSDTKENQWVDFDAYASYKGINKEENEAGYNELKTTYDTILAYIDGGEDSNGYYILIITAAAVTFFTQLLSAKILAPKGQKLNTMNKVMMVAMPLMMLMFAMTSNAVFTLYIIVNSIMSALISTVITLITNAKNKGKSDTDIILSKKNIEVVEYSRNYKK